MKKSISILILVLLIAEASLLTACGTSMTTVPEGPPVIRSFTVEKQTVELGEVPVFLFEVENASAITITQNGEVVFQIEATGTEGAFQQPLGNVAYALTTDGTKPEQPYPAGIYPVIYKGATTGKPQTWSRDPKDYYGFVNPCMIWGNDSEECEHWHGDFSPSDWMDDDWYSKRKPPQMVAIDVVSPSGEKATSELEYLIALPSSSEKPISTWQGRINEFTIKNVEGIAGEPVEFVVDVSNPARITIEGGHVLGNIFFQQEFTSDMECPFDFKATVTGPPPTKEGEPSFYKITVIDRVGQEYSQEESLEGSSCIW